MRKEKAGVRVIASLKESYHNHMMDFTPEQVKERQDWGYTVRDNGVLVFVRIQVVLPVNLKGRKTIQGRLKKMGFDLYTLKTSHLPLLRQAVAYLKETFPDVVWEGELFEDDMGLAQRLHKYNSEHVCGGMLALKMAKHFVATATDATEAELSEAKKYIADRAELEGRAIMGQFADAILGILK